MRKKQRFLLFIAAVTVAGILLFQCWWVYNSYKTGERNLHAELTTILQHSIDNYQVQQIKLPATLSEKAPHVDLMEYKTTMPGTKGKNGTFLKFDQVSVDPGDIDRVKLMMAQLLSAKADSPVRLEILRRLFSDELRKNNFDVSFTLTLLPSGQTQLRDRITGYVNFSRQGPVLVADIDNIKGTLLKQNLFPALVSLALILLSAGSLFYMWMIIGRQTKLDRLKNSFISNITHEFRTPLSILKSTHEILTQFGEMEDREKTARYLKINQDIIGKLEQNVDRVLEITQLESGVRLAKKETVNMDALIREIINRFTVIDGVAITLMNDAGLTTVQSDGYVIDTVMTNLIDNAIKYAGGKVNIAIQTGASTDGWQLTVADDGSGIDQQYLPFIFDKFYRVPSGDLHDVKGYGLGLSYVQQLVASLGGKIEVRSKLKAGTTFIIKFPNG